MFGKIGLENVILQKKLKKDKRRLKNIINYAIDNERPLEQIETLESLL